MSDSTFENLAWLERADNPFGVRCLDCRGFSRSMISTTQSQTVADRFLELRKSTGQQHIGSVPPRAITVPCRLAYPPLERSSDGPLFVAEAMEDKWDIYLHAGDLYFARSWTGNLIFRAAVNRTSAQTEVSSIDADGQAASRDPSHAARQVDFLIKSHIFGREVPHPLPAELTDDVETIAMYSFSQYGRRASFATYEDTTRIP